MRRIIALIWAIVLSAGNLFPQLPLWQWAVQIASPGNEQTYDMCLDASGDILVCGSYDGNLGVIFGIPFITPNQKDGFIAKYSAAGNFQWAFRIGGSTNEEVTGIAIDATGNIYVTGYFEGTTDFDPGIFSTANLTSTGGSDGFLAKYSSGGSLSWAIKFGGTGDDEGTKVATSGNKVFITGHTQPGATFLSTNSATSAALSSPSQVNGFIARYDQNGVIQWVATAGSAGTDYGRDLVADTSRVYAIGEYAANFTAFDVVATAVASVVAQTTTKPDVFVVSYDHSGNVIWLTNACSSDDDVGSSIAMDDTNLYITGGFKNGTMNFKYPSATLTQTNAGGSDIFIASLLKADGSYQWISPHTGSGPADESGLVIICDASKNLVVGGSYKGVLSYTNIGGPSSTSVGNEDIFLTGYTGNGTFGWNTTAGGGNVDKPYGLCHTNTGAVYATGEHANGISFGSILLPNLAGKNIFIAKSGCEGVSNNSIAGNQTVCAGSSPTVLAGSLPVPVSGSVAYQWQQSANNFSWTIAPGTNASKDYTPGIVNTTTYFRRIVLASGSCTFAGNTVSVVVVSPPSNASAGADQTVCASSAVLNAAVPAVGTGIWNPFTGTGTLSSPNLPSSGVTGLSGGANVFVWTVSNGICPPNFDTAVVWRDLPPGPVVTAPDFTICSSSATVSAFSPTTGSGSWSTAGPATLSMPLNATTAVTGIPTGTTQFIWTVSNGSCPPATVALNVQHDAVPGPVSAGAGYSLCNSSGTLSALAPLTGTGAWSAPAGVTLNNPFSTTVTASGLQAGANNFTWTVTNGVCAPLSATTGIWRDLPPGPVITAPDQTVCSSSATVSAFSPTTGSGSWSTAGPATLSMPLNATTAVTGIPTGTTQFIWTVSNGSCPPATVALNVQHDAVPGPVSAGAGYSLCNSSGTLSAVAPLTGTGAWSAPAGVTLNNPFSTTVTASGLQAGANNFTWTVTNGVCAPLSATTGIWRDLLPGPVITAPDFTICSSSATVSAFSPTTGSGSWSTAGPATLSMPLNATTAVTGIPTGTTQFIWTVSNGSCPPATVALNVQHDAVPGPVSAGAGYSICNSSGTLSAVAPLTGTGAWSAPAGVTLNNPLSSTVTASGLQAGANNFTWTVTNGVCAPLSATTGIWRDLPPGPVITAPDFTICSSSATVSAFSPTTGSGSWSTAGPATLSMPLNATTAVTGIPTGTTQFIWTVSNGSCPPATVTLNVQHDAVPGPVSAGAGYSLCNSSGTLSAVAPLTGTGAWSAPAGVTLNNPFSSTVTASGLQAGANNFTWTVTNGVCAPLSATTGIWRDLPPGPVITAPDQTVCATTATISAVTLTTGTGIWSSSGSASITTAQIETTIVSSLPTGLSQFFWTATNGVCPSDQATVNVQRDAEPGPTGTVPSYTICGVTASLSALTQTTGAGIWTSTTGASIQNPQSAVTTAGNLQGGPNTFVWTVSNGVCPPAASTLTITRDLPPGPAVTAGDFTVCATSAPITALSPTSGSGSWSTNGSAGIMSPLNATTNVNGLPTGISEFIWTVVNGSCPPASVTLSVQRDDFPGPATVAPSYSICNASATLSATTPTTGAGNWSALTGGATISNPSATLTSANNLQVGINSFEWTVTNGVCPPVSATISVTRDQLPSTAATGGNQNVCGSTVTLSATAPLVGTGTWTILSGSGLISSVQNPSATVTGLSTGDAVLAWGIQNGTCPMSIDQLTVTSFAPPSPANAGSDQTICVSSTTLGALVPLAGTGTWSTGSSAQIGVPANPTTAVTSLTTGANLFVWTVSNGPCPAIADTVIISRLAPPGPASAGFSQTVCANSATIAAATPTAGTGAWSVFAGNGTITAPTSNSTSVSSLSTGQNTFVWLVSNGNCPPVSDTTTVQRDAFPDAADAGLSKTVCAVSATLNGNTPQIGTGSWSVIAGNGQIDDPASPGTAIFGLSSGHNAFVWSIGNGVCSLSSSTVSVWRDQEPSAALAGGDLGVCSLTAQLNAVPPATGTGSWTVENGNAIINDTHTTTPLVSSLQWGLNSFIWTVTNGVCPPNSDTVVIMRDQEPSNALAGPDQIVCGDSVMLTGNVPQIGINTWTDISGNGVIMSPSTPTTAVTQLGNGSTLLVYSISNGVCPPSTDTIRIETSHLPGPADAGPDQTTCKGEVILAAAPPTIGNGSWAVVAGEASIQDPDSPISGIIFNSTDSVVLKWTVRNGTCPEVSDDVVLVLDTLRAEPRAGEDVTTDLHRHRLSAGGGDSVAGRWEVVQGGGILADPTDPNTEITGLSEGKNVIRWIIENECGSSHDELIIFVNPLMVPNAVTPNGDGKNDTFHITGLENYSGVKLKIFNRWSALVFESADYRNDWMGQGLSGDNLADDTYYFILEIPGMGTQTGFITIIRQ